MIDIEPGSISPIVVADPSDRRFPVFPPDILEELFEFGERRELATGDVLDSAMSAIGDQPTLGSTDRIG